MKENSRKSKLNKLLLIGIITVIIFWILIPSISIIYFGGAKSAGEFGDTFGIINALFSSLAFALLIYTSFMQREELELQRKELKLTRRELKMTRIELEKSAEAQNRLVVLTQEELELQKTQKPPELKFESARWIPDSKENYYELTLKTKYHKLKINKIFTTKDEDFKIEDELSTKIIGKYFEESSIIFIYLVTKDKKYEYPESLRITITYQDIDSNAYIQYLRLDKANQTISSPKGISNEGFSI
jgi:hypothetical protein